MWLQCYWLVEEGSHILLFVSVSSCQHQDIILQEQEGGGGERRSNAMLKTSPQPIKYCVHVKLFQDDEGTNDRNGNIIIPLPCTVHH